MPDETPLSIYHPERPAVGGVVVIQEIFGVSDHIEDVCQRIAHFGWLAVAPHLFWRTGDPVVATDDFGTALEHTGKLTPEGILADVDVALAYIQDAGLPLDATGIVGFCAGGTIAFAVATQRPIGAAVTYYGGGITEPRLGFPPMAEAAPALTVPWLGLYGDLDQSIPTDQVDLLADAAAQAEVNTEVIRYADAGHAFNRDGGPSYEPASAEDAWRRMLDWFADNLTTGATETI
jgi:carboxymethylenebutenolidase